MEERAPQMESNQQTSAERFEQGSSVIYGVHGRCRVDGIEEKTVGGQTIAFYRLSIEKPLLPSNMRPQKHEPSIFIPIQDAKRRGLRRVMSDVEIQEVLEILSSREYFFPLTTAWRELLPQLESEIEQGGAVGLAKVLSYTSVLKSRQVVPSSEVIKFHEKIEKVIVRELAELLELSIKEVEGDIHQRVQNKLLPDN